MLERVEQGRPAARVEMGRNLVEKGDRNDPGHLRDELRMREHKTEEQGLLLPRRRARRGCVFGPMPDDKVADMGADGSPPCGRVAAAIVAQDPAIAVLSRYRRAVRDKRLDFALKGEAGPGKG